MRFMRGHGDDQIAAAAVAQGGPVPAVASPVASGSVVTAPPVSIPTGITPAPTVAAPASSLLTTAEGFLSTDSLGFGLPDWAYAAILIGGAWLFFGGKKHR